MMVPPEEDDRPEDADEVWHPVSSAAADPRPGAPVPYRPNWFTPLREARLARKRFDTSRASHWLAAMAVGLVLAVIGLNLIFQVYLIVTGESTAGAIATEEIVFGLLLNMVLFIGAPLIWVRVMYYGGTEAVRDRLFLRSHDPLKDVLIGVGAGLLGILLAIVSVLVFQGFGGDTDNPVVEGLGSQLTWSLVLFIPFAAATSEELLFRSFLQPRVGIVPANVLFGVVHLSYQTPLQVLVPMMLGFLFSWTLLRRRSVLPAMVGHFVFNFVALTVTKLGHDLGWTEGAFFPF